MSRGYFLIFAWGLITCNALGQTYPADTARVLKLLQQGISYQTRPGDEKSDIDSALFFTQQAETLSHRIGYAHGVQATALAIADIAFESHNYPLAWTRFSTLDDSSRANFYASIINFRILPGGYSSADIDSSAMAADRLAGLLRFVRSTGNINFAYTALAGFYFRISDRKRSVEYAVQRFQLIRKAGTVEDEAVYAEAMVSWYYPDSFYTPHMYSMLEQLESDDERALPALSNEKQHALIYKLAYIGNIFYYGKQTEACLRVERLAIKLNERLHQHVSLPYSMFSYIYANEGKTKEGLTYALDAVRVTETPSGPVDGTGYEAAARMYYLMEDLDKSLEYSYKILTLYGKDPTLVGNPGGLFHRSIEILLKQHKPAEALKLLAVMRHPPHGVVLNFNDKAYFDLSTADCYHALGRRDSARYYYDEVMKEVPQGKYTPTKAMAYNGLATYYTSLSQYNRARPLLDTILADSNRAHLTQYMLANAWWLRYQADSAGHNYAQCVTDLRVYQTLHDSLTNIAKNKQLAEMDVQYETEKKNQHIADLEKQSALQASLQQATLRQEHIVRNSLIAGALVLALFAAGLYNRYRTRQRMNRDLQTLAGSLQKLVGEKEWLLREIHHRVKNNLHLVISLLHLQSEQLKDEIAISAFHEISARITAISLVHKKLYLEGQNVASIDMRDYIHELTDQLRKGIGLRRYIRYTFDIPHIYLDVAQAVPLGLILNEVITNAIKYAFPDDTFEDPEISITLSEEPDGWISLLATDNGIGLPTGLHAETSSSLGLQLIHILTLQLEGEVSMTSDKGVATRIRFEKRH